MPRESSFTSDQLAERALHQFWHHGFHATSMDALVRATKVSRHGIYASFGGKKELFAACFERYQTLVVSPAFGVVEQPGANLDSIAAYFEFQITGAENSGLPGPGCFVANSATEVAPHDTEARKHVAAHNDRLRQGYLNALGNVRGSDPQRPHADLTSLADLCVIFTNGLWSTSRTTTDGDDLRAAVTRFLDLLKGELS